MTRLTTAAALVAMVVGYTLPGWTATLPVGYAAALFLAAPAAAAVGFRLGRSTAIRKTGVGMVRAGTHRLLTGRL